MARVGLYSVVAKRADLIAWQFYSFRHLRDPWEFTVLCNVEPDDPLHAHTHWQCSALGLRCFDVPDQDHRTANWHHARALEWGWGSVVLPDAPDIAVWLDFDCFAFRPFSFAEWLGDAAIGGVWQSKGGEERVHYLWPGFTALKPRLLPGPEDISFLCGKIGEINVDVGGMMVEYLRAHPEYGRSSPAGLSQKASVGFDMPIDSGGLLSPGYNPEWGSWVIGGAWLHYANGGNWRGWPAEVEAAKTEWLRRVLR